MKIIIIITIITTEAKHKVKSRDPGVGNMCFSRVRTSVPKPGVFPLTGSCFFKFIFTTQTPNYA